MTLRVVDSELDRDIADNVAECRRRWAGIGAKFVLFEIQPSDAERYEHVLKTQLATIQLEMSLERLKALVEKREAQL